MAAKLPAVHASVDRIHRYADGAGICWISFKTTDGEFLTCERHENALRSFATVQRAILRDTGVHIENSRYRDPAYWEAEILSAAFRGLK
jgi:hypothetical protein